MKNGEIIEFVEVAPYPQVGFELLKVIVDESSYTPGEFVQKYFLGSPLVMITSSKNCGMAK